LQAFKTRIELNPLSQYCIPFVGLATGKYHYHFEVNDKFFACFEDSEVQKGNLLTDLWLEKQNHLMVFNFSITGSVELLCDLCLEPYQQTLNIEKRLIIKFGAAFEEQTEEILIIPMSESHFDVSQYLYEFIHLGLPMQRKHSENGENGVGCDQETLQKVQQYLKQTNNTESSGSNSPWSALRGLNFEDSQTS